MDARSRILDAALRVFSHHGFRQTSMESVAEAVGVTRQALYRHFPNKDALFAAVAEMLHAGAIEQARSAAEQAQVDRLDLAQIVTVALEARFSHLIGRVAQSLHADELLDEHSRHCGAITARHTQRMELILADVIETEIAERRLRLAEGLSASMLASYLCVATKGLKASMPAASIESVRRELPGLVRVLVFGAVDTASERKPKHQGGSTQ